MWDAEAVTDVTDRGEVIRHRRFPAYPEYKETGVEWLGEIPAHWDVERLKYLATLNDEVLPESTNRSLEMTYVDIGSVDADAGITETEAVVFEKAPSRARRVVRGGDIIVSTVRTYLRAISAITASHPNLIVSTGFAVVASSAPGQLIRFVRATSTALRGARSRELRRSQLPGHQCERSRLLPDSVP